MDENTKNQEDKYWLAFSQIKKIGPLNFGKIVRHFSSLESAWRAPAHELIAAGLEPKLTDCIILERENINPEKELERLYQEEVKITKIIDPDYPPLLKEIYNPPPLIYCRGDLTCCNQPTLAVVGTRKNSLYGKQAAEQIVDELVSAGITIVSGLALGIDAIAHFKCLQSSGATAAVLGSGADWQNVYPSVNRHLAKKIIETGGVVLSEFPLGTMPAKFTFPLRNRIVAGLSLGVLVVEAPESSGALITAKYALEQNREVFAVPGNIYNRNSAGTNNLIKQGAKTVTTVNDILEELNIKIIEEKISEKTRLNLNEEEKIIMQKLSKEPTHIDKIVILSKLKINALSSLLTIMEMKGLIKDLGGKNYIIGE